jgi:hypothetical protein
MFVTGMDSMHLSYKLFIRHTCPLALDTDKCFSAVTLQSKLASNEITDYERMNHSNISILLIYYYY